MVLVIPVVDDGRWVLEAENTPETPLHQRIVDLLVAIFMGWIERSSRDAMTGSNPALRWNEAKPSTGVDPDVYLIEPAPPKGELETSFCLWKPGQHPPRVAVEVVSEETARKDYEDGPARYAVSGTRELWVFDPLRHGPRDGGGPWVLQVWRRVRGKQFKKVYAGDGPAFSRELGAWVVVTDEGLRLRVADDQAGTKLWLTGEEEARRAEEEARRAEEEARRARAAAEREVARLQAELARLKAKRPPRKR